MTLTRPARALRSLLTLLVIIVGIISVPVAVWLLSGRTFLPELADQDPFGTLRAGQVPSGAVQWLSALVVWVSWAILVSIFVVEFVAVAVGRNRNVTGVRGGAKKVAEYILRVQLATAVVPAGAVAAPPPIVVVDDLGDSANETVPDSEGSLPDYFNFPIAGAADGTVDTAGEQPSTLDDNVSEPALSPSASDLGLPAIEGVEAERTDLLYTVKKGDTLWDITEEHYGEGTGARYPEVWEATDLDDQTPRLDPSNPDLIYPGNTVVVPNAGEPESSPVGEQDAGEAGRSEESHWARTHIPSDAPPPYVPEAEPPADTEDPIVSEAPHRSTTSPRPSGPQPSNSSRVIAAIAFVGLAGSAAALVLRGMVRRRRDDLDTSTSGQRRTSRRNRNAQKVEANLRARAGHDLWPVEDLQRCWDAIDPTDAFERQMWVSRFNRRDAQLEGSWTRGADGLDADAPLPSESSPWSLQPRRRPDGSHVNVWRIGKAEIPPPSAHGQSGVPLMASVGGDVFVNFDAVASLSIDSRDIERPAVGVVRSIQRQLVGQPVEWIVVGDRLPGIDESRVFEDADQACEVLKAELDDAGDTWDGHASLFEARRAGAVGRTKIVVGQADELQRSSLLLSIADTPNLPLTVIALGELPAPFVTINLSANDADVISVSYSSRSIQLGSCTYLTDEDVGVLEGVAPAEWDEPPAPPDGSASTDPQPFVETKLEPSPWSNGALAGSGELPLTPPSGPDALQPAFVVDELVDDPTLVVVGDSTPDPSPRLRFRPANLGDDPITRSRGGEPPPAETLVADPLQPELGSNVPVGWDDSEHNDAGAIGDTDWFDLMEPDTDEAPPGGVDDDDLSWALGLSEAAAADIFARTADDLAGDAERFNELAKTSSADADEEEDDDPPGGNSTQMVIGEPPTGAFGASGLRLELVGPVRLLHNRGGEVIDIAGGQRPVTPQLLSLIAYLGFKTVMSGGVSPSQALEEFWPVDFDSPSKSLGDTRRVSRRVTDARKALEELVGQDYTLITSAKNGSPYTLVDITIDIDELETARKRFNKEQGSCGELVGEVARLARGPALLTLPTGVRPSYWQWTHEVEPVVHNTIRHITDGLIDCSRSTEDPTVRRTALEAAGNVHAGMMADLATAWVEHHFTLGEFAEADAVVARYETNSSHTGNSRPRQHLDSLRSASTRDDEQRAG